MRLFRFSAIAIAFILVLSLCACSGDTSTVSSSTSTPITSAPVTTISRAEEERLKLEEIQRLTAEEVERMRLEEETRLASLPSLPNIGAGEYETIEFGGYEWRVLDIVEDRVLLISEKILFDAICHEYFPTIKEDGIPWAEWELRAYLNGEFYDSFSTEDRARIVTVSNSNRVNYNNSISEGEDTQDNIFLLSVEEASKYFGGEYDAANNAMVNDNRFIGNRIAYHVGGSFFSYDWENHRYEYSVKPGAAHRWLLRSPGVYTEGSTFVEETGLIDTYGQPVTFSEGIRPALWLRIESSSDIAERTVAVLPSLTNELSRLSGGDTVSTQADAKELLLNSQSSLKMDASTNITINKTDAFSLALTVDSGAVMADITGLNSGDGYQVAAGDITVSVNQAAFAIENDSAPRILMLSGSGMINGHTKLSEGETATVENGEIIISTITIDDSLSTVALEGIIRNSHAFSLPEDELKRAQQLFDIRGGQPNASVNEIPEVAIFAQSGYGVATDKSVYQLEEKMQVRVQGVTREMVEKSAYVGIYMRGYESHSECQDYNYPGEGETTMNFYAPSTPGEYVICLYDEEYSNANPALLASFPFRVTDD